MSKQNSNQKKRKAGTNYPNALTRHHVKTSHQFSFFETEWNGDIKEVHYRTLSTATMVRIADPETRKRPDLLDYCIGLITEHVVDITTGQPLMSKEEWMEEDSDLVIEVISKVTGLMFGGLPGQEQAEQEGEKDVTPEELSAVADAVDPEVVDPN